MKKYLYKYRAIRDENSLEDDLTLNALFEHKAVFSSRKLFNDLFDSKIAFTGIKKLTFKECWILDSISKPSYLPTG